MPAPRRSILSGLVLLAALPGTGHAAPAMSPAEAAGERVMLARLRQLTGGDPGPSVVAVLRAMDDLEALGLPEEELNQVGREAFRTARRLAIQARRRKSLSATW